MFILLLIGVDNFQFVFFKLIHEIDQVHQFVFNVEIIYGDLLRTLEFYRGKIQYTFDFCSFKSLQCLLGSNIRYSHYGHTYIIVPDIVLQFLNWLNRDFAGLFYFFYIDVKSGGDPDTIFLKTAVGHQGFTYPANTHDNYLLDLVTPQDLVDLDQDIINGIPALLTSGYSKNAKILSDQRCRYTKRIRDIVRKDSYHAEGLKPVQ